MKTIFLQVPVPLDSLGIDMAQTNAPVEKTLSILELITSGGPGGQIILLWVTDKFFFFICHLMAARDQ